MPIKRVDLTPVHSLRIWSQGWGGDYGPTHSGRPEWPAQHVRASLSRSLSRWVTASETPALPGGPRLRYASRGDERNRQGPSGGCCEYEHVPTLGVRVGSARTRLHWMQGQSQDDPYDDYDHWPSAGHHHHSEGDQHDSQGGGDHNHPTQQSDLGGPARRHARGVLFAGRCEGCHAGRNRNDVHDDGDRFAQPLAGYLRAR